jgi:hypothetical protein
LPEQTEIAVLKLAAVKKQWTAKRSAEGLMKRNLLRARVIE